MAQDIRRPLRKILPHILKAKRDNLNEADTCTLICEILQSVLGYNPLRDLSREVVVKKGRADFAIKVDNAVKFIVEAKAAGVVLRSRHIGQGERYAAEGNIPWVLVTNGSAWHLYHLTFDEGIEYETAFAVDLSVDDVAKAAEADG
jgi:predicted type IV restriction endonuclease